MVRTLITKSNETLFTTVRTRDHLLLNRRYFSIYIKYADFRKKY